VGDREGSSQNFHYDTGGKHARRHIVYHCLPCRHPLLLVPDHARTTVRRPSFRRAKSSYLRRIIVGCFPAVRMRAACLILPTCGAVDAVKPDVPVLRTQSFAGTNPNGQHPPSNLPRARPKPACGTLTTYQPWSRSMYKRAARAPPRTAQSKRFRRHPRHRPPRHHLSVLPSTCPLTAKTRVRTLVILPYTSPQC
jgi:hypothetical protein